MDNRRRMMWKKPPEYAIYYTSTDGNIIDFTGFASGNVISNTYENGIGKCLYKRKLLSIVNHLSDDAKARLVSIYLPDTITEFYNHSTFRDCINLTEVILPDNLLQLPGSVFYNCSKLTSFNIPSACSRIETSAFYGCEALTTIEIPDSVTFLGMNVFYNCTNLTHIRIGNGVTSIDRIIHSNSKLSYLYLGDNITTINHLSQMPDLAFIRLPPNVTSFYAVDFRQSTKLPIIDNVIYADNYLVDVVDRSQPFTIQPGTRYIGNGACANCTNLDSIYIPESIIRIQQGAFKNCTNLKRVDISNINN